MILQRQEEKKNKISKSNWAWKFSLEAKSKFFKFSLKATNFFPSVSSKFTPFPINFTITLTKSNTHNSKSIKSKFLGFFRKFRFRSGKGESAAAVANGIVNNVYRNPRVSKNRAKFVTYEEPNYVVSIVVPFIGLLSRSILQKDQKGIILYSSIILLLFAVIFVISLQRGNPFTDIVAFSIR